jgi:hypothetical protein
VEKHSGTPQMASLLAAESERHEDESGQHVGTVACSPTTNVVDPPCDMQDAAPRESSGSAPILGHAIGRGLRSPSSAQKFRKLGPPPIGWVSR